MVGIFTTWSVILNPHWYMPKIFFDGSQKSTINIFLQRTKFTVLDVYHMKCKSFNRYDKQNLGNKKNYPPIYQKISKNNKPTD